LTDDEKEKAGKIEVPTLDKVQALTLFKYKLSLSSNLMKEMNFAEL